jgi:hypothetical protein
MEYAMALNLKPVGQAKENAGEAASAAIFDLDKERLRILRCTAQAMACSPGGLRFEAGTRPWLEGILVSSPASVKRNGRRGDTTSRLVAN